ncbi:HET-domain-containing protein [Pyrenochaeta sp. DS3sAY3a]|nr:HET-domain-containing protein [Pyrenochaeta sp. DS3sAY3a]
MASNSPRYEYTPLYAGDAIRVLNLQPASTYADELHVRLEMARFPSAAGRFDEQCLTPYEAVSYTWGEATFSYQLHCEGQIIEVTKNVDLLLRRLRKPSGPRILWIDSVCINQQDTKEKTFQIAMMDQIYSRASKVHVWLGEAAPSDRMQWVFDLFREIARSDRDEGKSMDWVVNKTDLWDTALPDAVDCFLSRPWFGRRWILQEVILGLDITLPERHLITIFGNIGIHEQSAKSVAKIAL